MAPTTSATKQNVVSRACNVEDIFLDFEARRAGLLRALTDDFVELHKQCDPDKMNMSLYGLPDKSWELKIPGVELYYHADIPRPTIGINFARSNKWWIYLVAFHCDSWLLAVAFYYAARSGFDQADRQRLHNMINELPTLVETLRLGATKNNQALESQAETSNQPKRSKKTPAYLKDYEV